MVKNGLAVFLGGIAFFIWGAVTWMALPTHKHNLRTLPEEQLVVDTLKVVVKEPGFYIFPSAFTPDGTKKDQKLFEEQHLKGPTGVLVFNPDGSPMMAPRQLFGSFLIGFFASFVTFLLLLVSRDRVKTLGHRVLMGALLGLMVSVVADGLYWNWFGFPFDVTLANLFDNVVGFALLGAVLSKFVP